MRRWVVPLLCLATAALLVVGVVVLARDEPRSTRPASAAVTTTSVPAPAASTTTVRPAANAEALVPQLQRFVERERALAFKAPVKATFLDDAAFRARVLRADAEDRKDVEKAQFVLRAMGLLDRDVDLVKAVESLLGVAVVGLYDPDTKDLVVRGAEPTAHVRVTLVHELTHALEDQHFDLKREGLGDEADVAFRALKEGSALRVEEAYLRALSEAEQKQSQEEGEAQFRLVPPDVPPVVKQALAFPYAYGPDVVSSLLEAGGKARLDAAFADPPSSTEQVLEPSRYLRGDKPRPVPMPRADGPAFDDGEIGQLFLVLMLRSELGLDAAVRAAKGWGGDRYVAWRDGDRSCVRMDFVMDSPKETDELVKSLREWAAARKGSATAAGPSLTTCG